MSENSKIEWTDHTFNPWIGCTKVDELCAHCYAEQATPTRVARKKGVELWGKGKSRQRTSESNWKEPLRWNKAPISGRCNACGMDVFAESWNTIQKKDVPWVCNCGGDISWIKPKVFCASLADWLDDEVPIEWLADLLKLIHDTPNLTWQLLTKRPENFMDRISRATARFWGTPGAQKYFDFCANWVEGGIAPPNVWIGTSVGTQKSADTRIPQLLAIPAKVRFLSCEPLLEKVDLTTVRHGSDPDLPALDFGVIHWVICGGESGPKARPMHPCWALALRDQCQAAKVPFFFKQWGEYAVRSGLNCGPDFGAIDPECKKWPQVIRLGEHGKNTRRLENAEGAGEEIYMQRVGKKLAGRLLDGREWNEFPEV